MERALLFLVLFGLLTATAAGAAAENRAGSSPRPPIKIGWIGPLTGNAAGLGVDSLPAAEIAAEEFNSHTAPGAPTLTIAAEDDQYLTASTVDAYTKLVHHDQIKILIVLTYGGLFALAPRAEKDGVLLIDPLDCDEAIAALPQNTLCVAKTSEDLGYYPARDAIARRLSPAGVLYFDGDPFMPNVAHAVKRKFREHNQALSFSETYNESTADFKPILLRAKSSGLKSLFFLGYDQLGLAIRQARDLGVTAQFYGLMTMSSPGFKELAGNATEGIIAPLWLAPRGGRYAAFLRSFKEKVGREPNMDLCTIPSYDVVRIVAEALEHGALDEQAAAIDAAKVRAHFYALKDYAGLSGKITMDPDGITRSFPLRLAVVKNGQFVPLHGETE